MKIDMFATEVQFTSHLIPIWHALPEWARGDFIVARSIAGYVQERGIPSAGYVAHDDTRPVLTASYGDHKRVRGMGRTRIAFTEHGAGQSYAADKSRPNEGAYAGGKDRGDTSLFLMPNEYSAERWRRAYPCIRTEVVGSPKLDTLPQRDESPGPTVCVSFHWDAQVVQEARTTFMHYRPALEGLASRFHVIGHGHPRALENPPRLRRMYGQIGIEVVPEFEDVCRQADLYVCDNSSSMFEFASTGRPVLVLNEPAGKYAGRGYRREVNHGGRFWDWAPVGINVWQPDELAAAVALALTDPPDVAAERDRVLDLVYQPRTGAAKRAAEVLLDWADVSQEAAA